MPIKVDESVIQELRDNCSAQKCIEALFSCVSKLAKAIGVNVSWTIVSVEETQVDRLTIQTEFGKLSAIIGVLAAGSRFNPIQYVKDRNNATKSHRQETGYFHSRQETDSKGTRGESESPTQKDVSS